MKAARLEDGVLHIRDLPTPEPADDEALIRMTAAGVCHSDLHIAHGDWAGVKPNGAIGHEGIGIVEKLGANAGGDVAVGDRVILGLGGANGGYWCGACEYCLSGLIRHCPQNKGIMGTFSEYFPVYAKSLVKLPDSVSDNEAPLACGGLTAYGAVKKLLKHHVLPGRPVAVIGAAGGLGHYAVQIASAFGYKVVAVDIGADRLEFCRTMGAEYAVEAADAASYARKQFGGVDAVLVFSSRLAGFELGMKMLRRAGLFVAVGIPPSSDGKLEIDPFMFFALEPTLIYSAVGNVQDMREVVQLAADGRLKSHVSRTGKLSDLESIFDDLQASRYFGRAVLTDLTA